MKVTCEHCKRRFDRPSGQVKYHHGKKGCRIFCGKRCAGKAKSARHWKPKAQRVAEKSEYDREYRRKNLAKLKAKKRAYYIRTFDPEKARRERKKRARYHVEYCRRYYSDPRRKAEKVAYDQARRADTYGEYGEAWKLLLLLGREVRTLLPSKYERLKQRGYYDEGGSHAQRSKEAKRRRAERDQPEGASLGDA